MNKGWNCTRNASISFSSCYHKYEKRVTTHKNPDNIGQMFIGKEDRERRSGKKIGKEDRERRSGKKIGKEDRERRSGKKIGKEAKLAAVRN
jgi:hypothetical protein